MRHALIVTPSGHLWVFLGQAVPTDGSGTLLCPLRNSQHLLPAETCGNKGVYDTPSLGSIAKPNQPETLFNLPKKCQLSTFGQCAAILQGYRPLGWLLQHVLLDGTEHAVSVRLTDHGTIRIHR